MKEHYNVFMADVPVAIPMIQRDYVQGADINFEKRDRFLRSMLDNLCDVSLGDYEIDFIYGSSDETNPDSHFQPVDGQQRLTTLALMAWSLNNRTDGAYDGRLPRLTYFTRPSTEQFTAHLFDYRITTPYDSVSKHLTTVPGWFARKWLQDPSIMAMLDMLDKIDSLLSEEPYAENTELIADRFFNDSPINFERLDMKQLSLGDDLYIKMNARGKMLTAFENWKAGFEGLLAREFNDVPYEHGSIPGMEGAPGLYDYFVHAIEHEWCDLLWPSAYARWKKLPEEERRKTTYPRIDEDFMRLLDFVSHFLLFSQTTKKDPKREDFDSDRDRRREEVYSGSPENVVKLLRVMDTFVRISATPGGMEAYFDKLFTRAYDPELKRVNLYEEVPSTNLFQLCLSDKLEYAPEMMLWALLQYLFHHPEAIDAPDDRLRDYLRIVMGWVSTLRQRLVDGVNVRRNIRLSDFREAAEIIAGLSKADDLFAALAANTQASLEPERRKARYLAAGKYDIVRVLSTCRDLYYCFSLLFGSMDAAASAGDYIRRFEQFMAMADGDRIRALVAHGYYGVPTMHNHYFYGLEKHWDFFFTIPEDAQGGRACHAAFTDWMTAAPESGKIKDPTRFAYYIHNYPDFLDAVLEDREPLHYFIREGESQYVAWAVKTMSTRPIMGYNVDPFGYAVSKLAKIQTPGFCLTDWSYYSENGRLYLQRSKEEVALQAVCFDEGWWIEKTDGRYSCIKEMYRRFERAEDADGNPTLVDTKGEFTFDGMTLLDLPDADRVTTMVRFLEAFA